MQKTLFSVRYLLPITCIVLAPILYVVLPEEMQIDAGVAFLAVGLSILLLNMLFRYGAEGDKERIVEQAARDHYQQYGRWPDEDYDS